MQQDLYFIKTTLQMICEHRAPKMEKNDDEVQNFMLEPLYFRATNLDELNTLIENFPVSFALIPF